MISNLKRSKRKDTTLRQMELSPLMLKKQGKRGNPERLPKREPRNLLLRILTRA
jgi:hypothetical protein